MKYAGMIFMLVLLPVTLLNATVYQGGERITVAREETIASDLMVGSRYLRIFGTVEGDVVAGAQEVRVEGTVAGDVMAGSGEVAIEGEVADDVYAAARDVIIRGTVHGMVVGFGRSIQIEGVVDDDVIAFGGEVLIRHNARVKGNVTVYAGKLLLDGGQVGGWVKGGVGHADLNGPVGGFVDLEAYEVRFGPEFRVDGPVILKLDDHMESEEIANLPAGAKITYQEKNSFYESPFFYGSFLAMLIVGILYVVFFKNFSRDLVSFTFQKPASSLGIGLLFLIAIPIVIVILLVLVLTIPIALASLAIYLILLYLSFVFTSVALGKYILDFARKNGNSRTLFWSLLTGLILIFLFTELPYIGWLIELAVICFGVGGFLQYLWDLKKSKEQPAAS